MKSSALGSRPARRAQVKEPGHVLSAPCSVQVQALREDKGQVPTKEDDDQKEIVYRSQVPVLPRRYAAPASDKTLSHPPPPPVPSAASAPSGILARLGQATRNFVDISILRRQQTEALTVTRKERAMLDESSSDNEEFYDTLSAEVSPRTVVPQSLAEVKAMEAAAVQGRGKQTSQEEEAIKLFDRFPYLIQQNVSCKILNHVMFMHM